MQSTIILVHGAFAESSSWHPVAATADSSRGHRVIAYANPLRSIAHDAAGLAALVRTIDGPVVLAGHSYGGAVITNVPADAGQIVGLVYVAGFALEAGESPGAAASLVPGGTLGETLEPGATAGWRCRSLHRAREVPRAVLRRPARTRGQRCWRSASGRSRRLLSQSRRASSPLWRSVPSWFIFGDHDRNIPVGAHRIMAERASAKRVVEIAGASHVVGVSHPSETADLILEAAR